ncbi:MAG TPA: hypothetical protein PK778_00300 [Bacillota bacterium]|nr:hypothetical protein [Bacillota bacterium]
MTRDILVASKRFRIKKGKDVTVNLTIRQDYASLAVCVVLRGRLSGTFSGIPVKLVGRCTCMKEYTDREGFVVFSSLKPGYYCIKIPRLCYCRIVALSPGDNYRCIMPIIR